MRGFFYQKKPPPLRPIVITIGLTFRPIVDIIGSGMNKKVHNNLQQNSPLVSVIMPVFNAEEFLAEAIESILSQTYKNLEIVIVDDASTDNSWETISEFANRYPKKIKARRLRKNRNKGGEVAGNIAFSLINPSSTFIARMDADDIALPHRIATQVKYLEKNTDVTAVGSIVRIIDEHGQKMGYKRAKETPEELYTNFFEISPMIHPTIMFRRSLLPKKTELYQTELISNNDYLTFSSMVARGHKFANIQKPLLLYRMHLTNDSVGNLKRGLWNSIPTRWWMITRDGYRPTIKSSIIAIAQLLIFLPMPQPILSLLYLTMRGFVSPKKILFTLFDQLQSSRVFRFVHYSSTNFFARINE